jgi:uncharacterized protein
VNDARTPPNVSPLTRPFWEAARRRELVCPVCLDCGQNFFTPQIACPHCLSENWEYQPSKGLGAIHSFTVVHRAPREGFDPPYVVADVDLDEGWHMLTNIVDCDPDDVRIGQRVRVTWFDTSDAVLPVFTPEGVPA